jgi:hypothetical protein
VNQTERLSVSLDRHGCDCPFGAQLQQLNAHPIG